MTDAVPGVAPAEGPAVPEPSAPTLVSIKDGWVRLHPKVTLPLGVAARVGAQRVIRESGRPEDIQAAIADAYVHHGIAAWSFDEPVSAGAADRLLDFEDALKVAEAADDLYSDEVFRPFGTPPSRSSPTTPMDGSTSVIRPSGKTPRTLSTPSSRNGTAGKL